MTPNRILFTVQAPAIGKLPEAELHVWVHDVSGLLWVTWFDPESETLVPYLEADRAECALVGDPTPEGAAEVARERTLEEITETFTRAAVEAGLDTSEGIRWSMLAGRFFAGERNAWAGRSQASVRYATEGDERNPENAQHRPLTLEDVTSTAAVDLVAPTTLLAELRVPAEETVWFNRPLPTQAQIWFNPEHRLVWLTIVNEHAEHDSEDDYPDDDAMAAFLPEDRHTGYVPALIDHVARVARPHSPETVLANLDDLFPDSPGAALIRRAVIDAFYRR